MSRVLRPVPDFPSFARMRRAIEAVGSEPGDRSTNPRVLSIHFNQSKFRFALLSSISASRRNRAGIHRMEKQAEEKSSAPSEGCRGQERPGQQISAPVLVFGRASKAGKSLETPATGRKALGLPPHSLTTSHRVGFRLALPACDRARPASLWPPTLDAAQSRRWHPARNTSRGLKSAAAAAAATAAGF